MSVDSGEPTTQKMPGPPDEDAPDTVRILPDSQHSYSGAPTERISGEGQLTPGTVYAASPGEAQPSVISYDASQDNRQLLASPTSEPAQGLAGNGEGRALAQGPDAAKAAQTRSGPSGCAILGVTFAFVVLACGLLAYATFQSGVQGLGNLFGWVPNLFPAPKTTIDASQPSVIEQVRAVSQLVTVRYQVEKVVEGKSTGWAPEFIVSDKILFIAHGEVVAGVDLSKVKPEDITVVSDTVTITLPKPEVLFSKLDNDKSRVYSRTGGIVPVNDPNLETEIRQVAEQQIVQSAMEDGILTQATDNAKTALRALLTGLGYKQVDFKEAP